MGGGLTLTNLLLTDAGSKVPIEFGGAIFSGGSLGLRSVTVQNSANAGTGANGGAIWNEGGSLNVQQSTFIGNSSGGTGGAIANDENGAAIIRDSTFTHNASGWGGAIANFDSGTMTVVGSTFSGNIGDGGGGALYSAFDGTLTVLNSTVTDNTAISAGGALWVRDEPGGTARATLENVTLSDNTVFRPGVGGAINNSGGTVTVANTIVSGGSSPLCSGPVTDQGYNLQFGDTSCGFAVHAVTADPKLGPLAENSGSTQTQALGAGSPAIGAGNPTVCLSPEIDDVDQRSHSRHTLIRGNCDIGAFDTGAGPPSGVKTVIDRSPDTITADGFSTATITVLAVDANGLALAIGGATVVLQRRSGRSRR
jgi:hypothetical protein